MHSLGRLSVGLVSGVLLLGFSTRSASAQCVDESLRDELIGSRHYQGVQERLFNKALRHELSPMGGWYASDLYSGAPTYGGAYTFHFSEELGLEASYLRTRRKSDLIDAIQKGNVITRQLLTDSSAVNMYFGHLLWSLAYGKVRWMGGAISRFDFYLAAGAGITDDGTARGLTGSGGFGLKFYLNNWLGLRLDARDHVHHQEILGVGQLVNDLILTGGFSVFIPFSS